MARLPSISGREAARVFGRFGWTIARHKNHIIMTRPGDIVSLSIPDHPEVAKGTPRALLRQAGLPIDPFIQAMN